MLRLGSEMHGVSTRTEMCGYILAKLGISITESSPTHHGTIDLIRLLLAGSNAYTLVLSASGDERYSVIFCIGICFVSFNIMHSSCMCLIIACTGDCDVEQQTRLHALAHGGVWAQGKGYRRGWSEVWVVSSRRSTAGSSLS